MMYFTPADSIERTPLSVRSHNALRRAGIHTVADLLAYDREKMIDIRNLGAKSLREICEFLDALSSETGAFRLLTDVSEPADAEACVTTEPISVFRDADGQLRMDVRLADLDLSAKSYNRLKAAGYAFASQLIGMTEDSLLSLERIGAICAREILHKMDGIVFPDVKNATLLSDENAACKAVAHKMANHFSIHGGQLYQVLLPIYVSAEESGGAPAPTDLFAVPYLRNAVKRTLLALLSDLPFGVEGVHDLSPLLGYDMDADVMQAILNELEADGQITINDKIERRRMTILAYAQSMQKENERVFLTKRLQGQTLEGIAIAHGITRERVRQVVAKSLRGRPVVAEDTYIKIFETYDISKKDFSIAFDADVTVYNYLALVCKKRGTRRIDELSADEALPSTFRRCAERAIYKNHILIDGAWVYKRRAELSDYVIRTYFQDSGSFDDFVAYYEMLLEDLGLSKDPKFAINPRTYENKLGEHDQVLWSRGRRFRYYCMESYDFYDFRAELSLHQYTDVEYSALKLFRDHPALMRRYDIRDEYELHNLLKKQCAKDKIDGITFGRMPMIEFGAADRDKQVLDMLIQLAPVSIQAFSAAYEAEYGVLPGTFLADFLKNFSAYFHNGIYDISTPPLPDEQFERMREILVEDYYEIADIKRLYRWAFPNEPADNINPYTLKTLGFKVFVSYVVKQTYRTASAYFRALLTADDLVDARKFPPGLTGKVSYGSELYALKGRYEIIEFEPSQYIHIRRLNSMGITVEHLKAYCDAVAQYADAGEYFTVKSLRSRGFTHALEALGFSDVFYASLLSEDTNRFSHQRLGGVKLFRRGASDITLSRVIESILTHETAIGIHALVELLEKQFGASVDRYRLIESVKKSTLYYDSNTETVYVNGSANDKSVE